MLNKESQQAEVSIWSGSDGSITHLFYCGLVWKLILCTGGAQLHYKATTMQIRLLYKHVSLKAASDDQTRRSWWRENNKKLEIQPGDWVVWCQLSSFTDDDEA